MPQTRSQARQAEASEWHKALWRDQPFSDNYTDTRFLESLVVNAVGAHRSYAKVVWGATAVDQQICIAVIVASTAYSLHEVRNMLLPCLQYVAERSCSAGMIIVNTASSTTSKKFVPAGYFGSFHAPPLPVRRLDTGVDYVSMRHHPSRSQSSTPGPHPSGSSLCRHRRSSICLLGSLYCRPFSTVPHAHSLNQR